MEGLEPAGEQQRIDALESQIHRDHVTIRGLEEQAVADRAVIAHLEAEGMLDRERIANLEVALTTARRIGAAMGILMSRRRLTDVQAFELLREASHVRQRKLRELAEDVLLAGDLP